MYQIDSRTYEPKRLAHWLLLAQQMNLTPGPGGSTMTNFRAALKLYGEDLDYLFGAGNVKQATLVVLAPSSQIVGHKDSPNDVHGRRLHIPLQTNPGCWSFHDGRWQHLEIGYGYWMDPTVEHGAVNWGTSTRLHLMVDVG